MGTAFNSGGFTFSGPEESKGPSEHTELPRTDRELATRIVEHYNVDSAERSALTGIIEREIKGMDPESRHSLLRWVNEIDRHDTYFIPGTFMTAPNAKILEGHMQKRFEIAGQMYNLINAHMQKKLAAMRGSDDSAFFDLGSTSDRKSIGGKVDRIEDRLSSDKIPTGQEIAEWRTYLNGVLKNGIDVEKDKNGATRRRVQYILTSVESLKNLNKVQMNTKALLASPGGRSLVEHGFLLPSGEVHPNLLNGRTTEPVRDPVKLAGRLAAFATSTTLGVLSSIPVMRKIAAGQPLSVFDAWFPFYTGIALVTGGFLPKGMDDLEKVMSAKVKTGTSELSHWFKNRVIEPAARTGIYAYNDRMQAIYTEMGGKEIAAKAAENLHDELQDGSQRAALRKALKNRSITNEFLKDFAGETSDLSLAVVKLSPEQRVNFLGMLQDLDIQKWEQLAAVYAALTNRIL